MSTQTLFCIYAALAFLTAFVGASLRERESYWPYLVGCLVGGALWPIAIVAGILVGIHREAKR